jgi:hypothetical protein
MFMKALLLLLAAGGLPACHSNPVAQEQDQAAESQAGAQVFDLSGCAQADLSAEEFLKCCQAATGFNFTYSESTQTVMRTASVRCEGPKELPAAEFERYFSEQLTRYGLKAKRVGPPSLGVFIVELASAS